MKLSRLWRWAMQASARELLPCERVARCCRTLASERVEILYAAVHRSAFYKGLQTCGSVWQCAVCSAKISERRREELARAVSAWVGRGRVMLATFTVQHERADSIGQVVGGLLDARKRLRSGRNGEELRNRFGLVGSVRALEVTHGPNGWHPHIHELLFVGPDCSGVALVGHLRAAWGRAVGAAGLRDVNSHGTDLRFADLDVAGYLAKFGHERTWGPEHELAKMVSKRGRGQNCSPIDLLAAYHCGADRAAGALWAVYALAFKGRRQLAWSPGLRALLALGEEQTDEELAAATESCAVLLASLSREQWRVVLGQDARADVLEVAGAGDPAQLWQFLASLGVRVLRGGSDEA